jgi:hypothetical protein
LLSKTAVSELGERLWEDYQAFMRNRFRKQLTPPDKQLAWREAARPCSRATCDAVLPGRDDSATIRSFTGKTRQSLSVPAWVPAEAGRISPQPRVDAESFSTPQSDS